MTMNVTRKAQVDEKNSSFYGIKIKDKHFTWVLLSIVTIQALFNTFGFFFFALNFIADIFITMILTGTGNIDVFGLKTFPSFIFYIIIVIFIEITKRNLKGKSKWIIRNMGWFFSAIIILIFFVVPIATFFG